MEREQGVPVVSIVRLRHLVSFVAGKTNSSDFSDDLVRLQLYREQYGVEY